MKPPNDAAVISSDMWRIIIISADQKITNDNAHQQDTDVESKTETDPRGRLCPLKTENSEIRNYLFLLL